MLRTREKKRELPTGGRQPAIRHPNAAGGVGCGPVYDTGGFRILAFRNTGSDHVYMQDVPLGAMSFDGSALSGTVQFPAGDYKFPALLRTGGAGQPHVAGPHGRRAFDALCVTHTQESFPAAFMLNAPLDAVPSCTVSLDGPKQTVSGTLPPRRFARGRTLHPGGRRTRRQASIPKNRATTSSAPKKLAGVKLSYTGANSRLGLSGEKAEGLFDVSHTIAVPADAVTTGTGVSTVVGADKYDFENVQPADIISGSAHLKGTYLIPNPDNTPATGFSMLLTSGKGSTRTIALTDKIPVERNKSDIDPNLRTGRQCLYHGVDFDVEVDTVWDGSNFVDGEID